MRKDMAKVIVERPRRGVRSAKRVKPGRSVALETEDGEPLRARAPKSDRRVKTKSLNENLAPLRRFLEGQAGRPWRKVYAEIAEHLKPTSTVQQHVRDHVGDFVAIQCRLRKGEIVTNDRWGGERPLSQDWRKLYVHPRTGLLMANPKPISFAKARKERAAAEAAERAARLRELGPDLQAHLLGDGAWWEVRLAKIKVRRRRRVGVNGQEVVVTEVDPFEDVVLSTSLTDMEAGALYGRHGVYAAAKRQFNKAEKKRLGLP